MHQVLHLGASWRGREGAEDRRSASGIAITNPFNDEFFRYRARGADLHLADRFVSTPQVFDEDQFWGVEAAAIWGPVHVVGEYTQLEGSVVRATFPGTPPLVPNLACCNGKDPTYDGWYVEAGWFLTGETRGYKEGEFVGVKVKNPVLGGGKGGGWGAWQIAGRYDVIDLTDQATTIQGNPISGPPSNPFPQSLSVNCTQCGEQKTWEVVLNWWLNDYTGLQFQYGESDIDGGPSSSPTLPASLRPPTKTTGPTSRALARACDITGNADYLVPSAARPPPLSQGRRFFFEDFCEL